MGSGNNGGISLGACRASCLVTGHGKPVIWRQGHFCPAATTQLATQVTSPITYALTDDRSSDVYPSNIMTISSGEISPEGRPPLGRFTLQRIDQDRWSIVRTRNGGTAQCSPQALRQPMLGGRALPTPNKRTSNNQFREARARTASLTHPKEGLSRQELAELVNAWIWKHHNTEVDFDRNYIGKIEQGVIRWPGAMCREAFREILSVSDDAELGFVNARARRQAVKLEEVDTAKRQKFVHTTTLGGVSLLLGEPVAAMLEGIRARPTPGRVGASDIAQIRDATQAFASLSRAYGGEAVLGTALGELHWAAGLLEAICPDRLRPELHAAVGYLANVVAFLAVDAGAQEEARQIYGFALACAEQAKDWNLRAEILSSMAKQAIWTGQPDEGLTLAEFALVRADWLTPAGRSLLHTDRARALARMRRVQESLRAIGTADEQFAHSTPENEPPWWGYYSAARHDQLTGQPLVDLAILGRDSGEATTRLTAAVAGQPDHPGCRAICLSKLASLTMATGDPRHAVTIGNEALEVAGTLRSHRATEELRELFRHAATHQDLGEVAELRHRIRTLVCTDNPGNPPLDPPPDSPSAKK
jgi:hypothetical protein